MALWVRSEENNSTSGKEFYDFIRRWQPIATKNHSILCCSIANDELVACCLDNNNIGILQMKSIGLNEDLQREI